MFILLEAVLQVSRFVIYVNLAKNQPKNAHSAKTLSFRRNENPKNSEFVVSFISWAISAIFAVTLACLPPSACGSPGQTTLTLATRWPHFSGLDSIIQPDQKRKLLVLRVHTARLAKRL